jgi:hypothetical protein
MASSVENCGREAGSRPPRFPAEFVNNVIHLVLIIKLRFQESLEEYVAFGYLYALVGSGSWVEDMSQSAFVHESRWESP